MNARVLVVEDEANIADYLVTGLREEGYTVEHAAEGDVGRRSPAGRRRGTSSCSTGGLPGWTAWRCSAGFASATAGPRCSS